DEALNNGGDVTKAKQAYKTAVEQADGKLGTAKSGANDDTAAWGKIASLYADQTDKIGTIQADIDELNGMTAEGNTTAKKSDIEAARERLQDDIKKATDIRGTEVSIATATVNANEANGDSEVGKMV
ncbi:hypothetical protein, partial [Weissella confusa]|uniref:hypothetical protein n=1 Tax=Weissella confusa TaxID=1583 RepID=UPI00223BD049